MDIKNIRIESGDNFIGIDEKKPIFSWQLKADENNIFQESYRIIVSKSKECDKDIVWDSGMVATEKTFEIVYDGQALEPDTKYYFKIFSKAGNEKIVSDTKYFITGLLRNTMEGDWISVDNVGCNIPETCPFVRKEFESEDIDYATLFIYSYGWYEAYLNGVKLDDRVFAPAKSNYKDLLYYDVYDITEKLRKGLNAFSLIIGDGYNLNSNMHMGRWNGAKRFIASVNMHLKDGSVKKVFTDSTWKFTMDTPIIYNNIYNGEFYDATKEINGWLEIGFDDSDWNNTHVCDKENQIKLIANPGPFIKEIEYRLPEKYHMLNDGRYILDFGQNLSGYVTFSLAGEKGKRIRIRTSEELICDLDKEYVLDTRTNREATSVDTYIFKGEGIESFHPRFSYHGFRYAEISGLSNPPGNEVKACIVHTEFSKISKFETDNQLINRIYNNAIWSMRSNSFSFPTDCPARDERTPCTMDMYAYLKTALYTFGYNGYYQRYFKNEILSSERTKNINMTWSGCIIALPWYFYRYFGSKVLIKRYYSELRAFEDRYLSRYPDLIPEPSFGDWCAPNELGDYFTSFSSCDETEQHAMYFTLKMMQEMADVVGNKDDSLRYKDLSERVAKIYRARFYSEEKRCYSDGKQSPNIFALVDGFVSSEEKADVENAILDSIIRNKGHLDVGIYGSRHFIEVLSDMGKVDLALDCFTNPEYPSFAYQISKGATTLWEQWCGVGGMSSHNHAMFSGAVSGFYTRLAGVTSVENAFAKVQIKPCITKYINELSAVIETVNGEIKVNYKIANGVFILKTAIPAGSRADIIMPDETKYTVDNGMFEFTSALRKE